MLCVSSLPSPASSPQSSRTMPQLREITTLDDVEFAKSMTNKTADLLPIHHALRNVPTNGAARHRLFAYPEDVPVFWFCFIDTPLETPTMLLVRDPSVLFDSASFEAGITLFLEKIAPSLQDAPRFNAVCERALSYELSRLIPSFVPHLSAVNKPYHLFYMNDAQLAKLAELEISLPYGYSFESVNLDEDAAEIAATSDDTLTVDAAKRRLSSLPYVLIRGPGGQAVSHELTSPSGGLTHLYTHPDHRRRGLGSSAELKLAQHNASLGNAPYKAVCTYNVSVHRSSEESPFWTMLNRKGTPVDFVFEQFQLP